MMNKIIILILSTMLLQGCTTADLWSESPKETITDTVHRTEIVTTSSKKPSQLMLIGEKYNYLIEGIKSPSIFEEVLLKSKIQDLHIYGFSANNQKGDQFSYDQQPVDIIIEKAYPTLNTSKNKELEQYNFVCKPNENQMVVCKKSISAYVHLTEKSKNFENIQVLDQNFNTPIEYTRIKPFGTTKKLLKTPKLIARDIAVFTTFTLVSPYFILGE